MQRTVKDGGTGVPPVIHAQDARATFKLRHGVKFATCTAKGHDIRTGFMDCPPALGLAQAAWRSAFGTMGRLLFFRASPDELANLGWRHLGVGLGCTWLVGIGRYWDNPRVGLLQHLGLGSLVYVFLLSLFLWLIIWPLRPRFWSYFRVLTFVTLISPPAILYAIPVQMFYGLDTANSINAWFLAVVAAWRVALLFFFLRRVGELGWFAIITATLLPLSLIVVVLTVLNLERVVFNLMGGMVNRSPNDGAYEVLLVLSWLSIVLFIPLLICYLAMIVSRLWAFKEEDAGLRKDDKHDR